ncbi:MAG: tetratricopeptide repeat protein [Candidatus Kapabacteria bacterium]|nr:tetratricopeptide repeat protein [Candidatus Kapabacteria bacterium]
MTTTIRQHITVICFLLLSVAVGTAQSSYDRAVELTNAGDYAGAAGVIVKAVDEDPDNVDVLVLASKVFLELEKPDSAVIYSQRAYNEEDDVSAIVRIHGQALIASKRFVEAIGILRKQLKRNDEVEVSLLLVDALIGADSIATAELTAKTATTKHAKSADAYMALGNLYFNYKPQPVFDLAKLNYEEAIKLNPDLVQAHFNLAQSYWRLANRESDEQLANELFKRCLMEWGEVTRLDPKNARAYFEQGKILYLSKRFKEAVSPLKLYRELRPVGTGNPLASWYLGNSLFETRYCDEAKVHLDDAATQIDSVKGKASLLMARCAFFTKAWPATRERYQIAEASNLLEAQDYWFYGTSLVLTGDTTKAIAMMDKGAELDPKQCMLMFRFGLLLQSKQLNARSTEIFQKRMANCSDSNDAKVLLFIGNNFFADSLVDSASSYYQRALQREPSNAYFMTRVAEVSIVRGDLPSAITTLDKAATTAIAGGTPDQLRTAEQSLLRLCGIHLQNKDWTSIIASAKRVTELNAKSTAGWLYLGVGNQGEGNTADACKAYKEALKLDPNNKPAKENLKSLGC